MKNKDYKVIGHNYFSGDDSCDTEPCKTETCHEKVKNQQVVAGPACYMRLLMKLTRSETEHDFYTIPFLYYATYPLILALELAVYLRFYYRHDLSFSIECIILFFICLAADTLLIWSHYRAAHGDPGFMEERYVSSYSDRDDGQDIEMQ